MFFAYIELIEPKGTIGIEVLSWFETVWNGTFKAAAAIKWFATDIGRVIGVMGNDKGTVF